jgi:hypothetical protein
LNCVSEHTVARALRSREILVRHRAFGSVFSPPRRVTGMAFPSVSRRHTEPLGAAVVALGLGAWARASFFARAIR